MGNREAQLTTRLLDPLAHDEGPVASVLVDFPDGPWTSFLSLAQEQQLTAYRLAPIGYDESVAPSAYAAVIAAEISTLPKRRVIIVGSCAAAALARRTAHHARSAGISAESISVDGEDLDQTGLEHVHRELMWQLDRSWRGVPQETSSADEWFAYRSAELVALAGSSPSLTDLPDSIVGQLVARLKAWLRHCTASYLCALSSDQTTACTAAEASARFAEAAALLRRAAR